MQLKKKTIEFQASDISKILLKNFSKLMLEFYEMQTSYLKTRYKAHKSLETSNIDICFIKNAHRIDAVVIFFVVDFPAP